jgi:hypothetical protein
MKAATHSERPPRLLRANENCWWSPLQKEDALLALQSLGASRSRDNCLLVAGSDVFCPALTFEAAPSHKGTQIRVETRMVGFGRDFGRAVQVGLTAFAALVLLQVVLGSHVSRRLWLCATVLLGWATCMGVFSAAHALLARLGRDAGALDRAKSRARSALFARGA